MHDDSSKWGSKDCAALLQMLKKGKKRGKKTGKIRSARLVSALAEGGGRAHSPVCLFSEPSGMPAGVWARSVSASEIEVNWQALSNSPERVLGYEVHFSLLNGNRNHTHTT